MTNQTRSDQKRDSNVDGPPSVTAKRVIRKPDPLRPRLDEAEDRQEALVYEGLREPFPAIDSAAPYR